MDSYFTLKYFINEICGNLFVNLIEGYMLFDWEMIFPRIITACV